MLRLLASTALASALLVGPAFADTASAVPTDFISTLVIPVLGTVVTVLLGWAISIFSRHTGLAVSQKYQDDLHSAAMTGISLGLHELGVAGAAALEGSGNAKLAVIGTAMAWINNKGAPDAIKALGLTPAEVQAFVAAKLNQAITAGNAPASAPVATPPGTAAGAV